MRVFLISFILFSFSLSLIGQSTSDQPTSEKLIRKGVRLHDMGSYREAINYYEQALKVNPSSMSATYEMALSYLKLKDYENALRYSTRVINANFKQLISEAYCVKASALAGMGKLDVSIDLLKEGIGRCGDDYQLNFNLGISYYNAGKNIEAQNYLKKAIEIDATHPSAFLLYAYALDDAGKWVQSILSFHFFLLLEPNTERSKDVFGEMYRVLDKKRDQNTLTVEEGVDRRQIYEKISKLSRGSDANSQYQFFQQASKIIFADLSVLQNDSHKGLLWDFYVPIYTEILNSGYFDTYCRYISASYFPQSLDWWNSNKTEVDQFITWFENGQGSEVEGDDGEEGSTPDTQHVPTNIPSHK